MGSEHVGREQGGTQNVLQQPAPQWWQFAKGRSVVGATELVRSVERQRYSMPPSVVVNTLAILSWGRAPLLLIDLGSGDVPPSAGSRRFGSLPSLVRLMDFVGSKRTLPYARLTLPSRDCPLGVSWSRFVHGLLR